MLSYAACFSAAIELNHGQAASARATLVSALDRAIAEGQRYGSSGAVVATYLIELLYEANELDVCQSLVEAYLPIIAETGLPDHLILTYRIAARLHFLRGQRDAGLAALVQLNELGARRGIRRLSSAAWLERSYAALRDKDIQSARRFLATGADPALWEQFSQLNMHASEVEDVTIAEIRVSLASGEAKQALAQAQAARGIAEASGRRRRGLRLQFLEAQSLESLGRGREAGAALDLVVAAAVEGGMARVLLDDCWATDLLIARAHSTEDPRATTLLRLMAEPTAAADAAAGRWARDVRISFDEPRSANPTAGLERELQQGDRPRPVPDGEHYRNPSAPHLQQTRHTQSHPSGGACARGRRDLTPREQRRRAIASIQRDGVG